MAWSTPATWVAGIPTVANFNTRIRDQFNALGDAWATYTPAWTASTTNPTLGNGTLNGFYREIGKTIDYRIELTIGSTTTFGSGSYRLSLPTVSKSAFAANVVTMGNAGLYDTSATTRYSRTAVYLTTTTIFLHDEAGTAWTPTVPFTLANTDLVCVSGTYEGA